MIYFGNLEQAVPSSLEKDFFVAVIVKITDN